MTEPELSRGRRLLFSAVVVVFVAVCVELIAQAFYYATAGDFLFRRVDLSVFESDPTRCYRVAPNLEHAHGTNEFSMTIYTNSQGLRTDRERRDVSVEKPADVYRVLFLGPSFTFGWGSDYEDIYATLIARGLRLPDRRVEGINLGTPAQGPGPQLCWLEQVGYRYRPDLVVQTSYGEDVSRVLGECPRELDCPVVEDGLLYGRTPTLRRRAIAVAKNLGVVFYGYYLYNALLAGPAPEAPDTGKELWSEAARAAAADAGDLIEDYRRYVAFVRRAVGDGVQVAFVHIPLSYEVHPEDASRWRHLRDPDPWSGRERTRASARALQRAGIALVDTTDALVAASADARMYYWLDIHLTPAGNRVVADAALPTLQALADGGG